MGPGSDPDWIRRVVGAGAKGYLSHAAGAAELLMAVEVVMDGSIWAPRKVLARLLAESRGKPAEVREEMHFTSREQEVLHLLVLGRGNREMADALKVDETTIKGHVGRLMRKAGVRNRIALTMRTIQQGWLQS